MPRYRYELAHYTFREHCLRNPKEFCAEMTAKNNEVYVQEILKSIGEIKDAEDSPVTSDEIKVSEHKTDFADILLIEMPEPVMMTDAYYVGIVLSSDSNNLFRYFTLEMDFDRNENERSMLCEWEGNRHLNVSLR